MLISIVIPVYNKESTINGTLQSVLNQTYSDFEIIIVDDGSTDSSLNEIKKSKDSRILVFEQENKGVSAARNFGIQKSKGELISFLDADDYWFPNHLDEIVKLYNDFPDDGMYVSRYSIKISNTKIVPTILKNVNTNYRGLLTDFFEASMINRVSFTSAVTINSKIQKQHNYLFNENYNAGEDIDFFTRIALKHNVYITDLVTVLYNFALDNQLSKITFSEKKLMKLDCFLEEEKINLSLKNFIDLYRIEYALQYKIAGNLILSNELLQKTDVNSISFKTKILLKLPTIILNLLLKIKRKLRKFGVDFTIYH